LQRAEPIFCIVSFPARGGRFRHSSSAGLTAKSGSSLRPERGKRLLRRPNWAPRRRKRKRGKGRGDRGRSGSRLAHRELRRPPSVLGRAQTSNRATKAFCSMKTRRGSTSSPMSLANISSAAMPSSICTFSRRRDCGSIVVSHSCSGFISPSPL
jgi:hypothetical protein